MSRSDFTKYVIEIDESMREIAALDELYGDITGSSISEDKELTLKKDEAKFARERMLKLSLHVKNLLAKIESGEKIE